MVKHGVLKLIIIVCVGADLVNLQVDADALISLL